MQEAEKLRETIQNIRRKPTPIKDLIPLMSKAADRLDELDFLRFYYFRSKEMFSEAGTDEAYFITEEYEEKTGKSAPEIQR